MGCKKCGECCKWVVMPAGPYLSSDEMKWIDAHGIKVVSRETSGCMLFVPAKCKHLTENNECAIYNERPGSCRVMPTRALLLYHPPECKYFEDETNKE